METNVESRNFGDGVSESTKKIAREHALKFGLYLGVINVFIMLILYFIDPLLMATNGVASSCLFVVSILLFVYFTLELKKAVGGYWNFRLAFSSIFIMLLISNLFLPIYQLVEFKIMDKELGQRTYEALVQKASRDLSAKGISGEDLAKQMEMVKKFIPIPGETKFLLFSIAGAVVISILFALLLAAIFKKERPVFGTSA